MAVPPVATLYHLYCPAIPPAALSVRLAAAQDEFPVVVGAVGNVLTVAMTADRGPSQVPLLMLT